MIAKNYKVFWLTVFLFVAASLGALLFASGNHVKQATPRTNVSENDKTNTNGAREKDSEGKVSVNTTVQNEVTSDVPLSMENLISNNINGNGQAQVSKNIDSILSGNVIGLFDNQIHNNLDSTVIANVANDLTNQLGDGTAVEVNNVLSNNSNGSQTENNSKNGNIDGKDGNNENSTLPDIIWGIDSASVTTAEFYGCVKNNFGDPVVFGRYIGERKGVSNGLTTEQVNLIHEKGDYILPIYNHFNNATGYENGIAEAQEAIRYAEKLGVPKGVALFADIEPNYPVDSAFIRGWYETVTASNYESGIYGIFNPGRDLYDAYKAAGDENPDILENNIIWTASPNIGITTEENAPEEYQPDAPEKSLAWGWQYGIDAEECNIDTNLFMREIVESLWGPDTK